MVDDKAGRVTEASGAEPRVVTIARDDEHIDARCDRLQDLTLDAPTPADQLSVGSAKASRSGGKQLGRLALGDVVIAGRRLPSGKAAPEQSSGSGAGSLGDVRRRDMQQREPRIGGEALLRGVNAAFPGSLDHPEHDMHRRH